MGQVVPIKTRTKPEHSAKPSGRESHFRFTPQRLDHLIRHNLVGYYYDLELKGLAVRIGKSKASYLYATRINGAYERRPIGDVQTMLLADARKATQALAGQIAAGNVPAPPRQARKEAERERAALRSRASFTLDVAFERYLAERDLKASTAATYRDSWKHAGPVASMPVADVTVDDIKALHAKVSRCGKRSANKLISLIGGIMAANGRRHDNPVAGVNMHRERPRTRRLAPEESKRLKEVLAVERHSRDIRRAKIATYVSVALQTGARRGSICAMRWRDVDLREGSDTWVVPAEWSKNGTEIAIALTNAAVAILTEWRERAPKSQWVFPSMDSASGHLVEPQKGWDTLRKIAGIPDVTLHDLRRSLGSEIAAAGGNATTIAAALGHLSLQSAKAYLHLNTAEVRAVLERIRK